MTNSQVASVLLVTSVAIAACDKREPSEAQPAPPAAAVKPSAEPRVRNVDPPAAPGSMAPNVHVTNDEVLATWLEPVGEDDFRLRYATFDGEWAEASTVVEGVDFFANWADVPSVARTDDELFAHWLQKVEGGTYAYGVAIARSVDEGKTWSPLGFVHHDGTPTEHGFANFIPIGSMSHLAWLDGRGMAADPPGPMTLRTRALDGTSVEGPAKILDTRVCDCCATDGVLTANGPVVVYRDRDEEEVRDISIVRLVEGSWTKPARVHADDWTIPGCPVNGPSVAAGGRDLAVAWFTGANQRAQVRVAMSTDAGASFAAPIVLDASVGAEAPLGRVDAVALGDGEFAVSWVDGAGEDAVIRVQRVSVEGRAGAPFDLATTSRSRSSGFPKLARMEAGLFAMWTEASKPSSLRAAVLPEAVLPAVATGNLVETVGDGPQVGWKLPVLRVETIDGEPTRVSVPEGSALVVNFWATWCEPCRKEMPLLDSLARDNDAVHVVAVSLDEKSQRDAVRRFVDERKLGLDVVLDPAGRSRAMFGITALPATYVFDAERSLVWWKHGEIRDVAEVAGALPRAATQRQPSE